MEREPMHECFSDASYAGIGAFSDYDEFNFCWRLTRNNLIQAGFDMKAIDEESGKPDGTSDGLHINMLEFIAMIIELWFVITKISKKGPIAGSYIVSLIKFV
jgi:hypothetical protein